MKRRKNFVEQCLSDGKSGKYSVTKTLGSIVVIIGTAGFVVGIIDKMFISKTIDIVTNSVWFTSLGAAMIGVKNVFQPKGAVTNFGTVQDEEASREVVTQPKKKTEPVPEDEQQINS